MFSPIPLLGRQAPVARRSPSLEDCQGWCSRCKQFHALPTAEAWGECLVLMAHLSRYHCLDFSQPSLAQRDPRCSTRALFQDHGGKMFGVLVGLNQQGLRQTIRAFSGQYNGLWHIDGWVPPVFDTTEFTVLNAAREPVIKELGRQIACSSGASRCGLIRERRRLSQQLMQDIHALYRLTNFHGHTQPLTEVFQGKGAPPTGTADCCGPKLLNFAARQGWRPLAMAEFFWGSEAPAGSRIHGQAYPPCTSRCAPILGFMLCGLA